MKTIRYSALTLSILFFQLTSCNNNVVAPDQQSTSQVKPRTDCEECTDCCCAIILDEDTAATLQLCGTEDGVSPCMDSPPSSCYSLSLSAGAQTIALNSSTNQRHAFCMLEFSTLKITNTSSTDDADIILTCQYDSGLPQTVQISLAPMEYIYYDVHTGCIVGACD